MEEKNIINPEEVIEDKILPDAEGEIISQEDLPGDEGEKKQEEKKVPLAALQESRAKLKAAREKSRETDELLERLYQKTNTTNPRELLAVMDSFDLAQYMNEHGVDEETAKKFMAIQKENSALKMQGSRNNFDKEAAELSGNPLYDDIEEVYDEVTEYADKKGLTLKEAYNVLFGEARAEKIRKAAEEEALNKSRVRDSKKIKALSQRGNASADEDDFGLSADEIKTAKRAGMTPKEYAKYKMKD